MVIRERWALCVAASLVAACGGGDTRRDTTPRVERDGFGLVSANEPTAFAQAMNAFGLDVWEGLRTSGHDGNLALSPASISTALGMVYTGARGQTATEIAYALHIESTPEEVAEGMGALLRGWNDPSRKDYTLAVVNRLFAERAFQLRSEFLALTRSAFGAEMQRLDFRREPERSRTAINAWVEAQTRDRIRELMPAGSITPGTRAVLVNAVYFYGTWERPFDAKRTKELPFFVGGADESDVPMMNGYGALYGEDDGVKLVELPYTGGELAMLVALPNARDGLPALEERLDAARVGQWRTRLYEEWELQLTLPRFRIETEAMPLGEVLHAVGIQRAFTDGAEFDGMNEPGQEALKIDEAYHKAFVEVDEKGTEAAAATGFAMASIESTSDGRPPVFYADHPFLFFIVERKTGAILFAGRVVDPR